MAYYAETGCSRPLNQAERLAEMESWRGTHDSGLGKAFLSFHISLDVQVVDT
jgi:hypothetical protein